MPRISVILCAYNASAFLKNAVESVLNQTQRDIELIIVNDGSLDSTLAVASYYSHIDRRVKVVNIENGGLANARNVGMSYAEGEFIAFCDADDTVDPDALQTMLSAAEQKNADLVMCGYHHDTVLSDGKVSTVDVFEPEAYYNSKEELFLGIVGLKSKFILDASWNKLFRRSCITDNGLKFPEGELFEDTAFVLSFLEHSCHVAVLPYCFYHYVQRKNGSITKKYDPRKLNDLKKRYRELSEFTADADETVKKFCCLYYIKNVYSALANSYNDKKLTKQQRRELIMSETKDAQFKNCAAKSQGLGLSDKLTVFIAKLGFLPLDRVYCRAIHFMKTKASAVFAKIK